MFQMFGLDQTKFFFSQKVLPKTESNARCVIQPFSEEKKLFSFSSFFRQKGIRRKNVLPTKWSFICFLRNEMFFCCCLRLNLNIRTIDAQRMGVRVWKVLNMNPLPRKFEEKNKNVIKTQISRPP